MYDEAIKARFRAFCRAHPAWFGAGLLAALHGLALESLDKPAPAQTAWRLMLERYAREILAAEHAGEDVVTRPIGWKAGG